MHIGDIREDMKVVGSDGTHVGTVDKVDGDQIKLTKEDSENGKHNFVPVDSVESVEGNTVTLNQTAQEAKDGFDAASAYDAAGSAVGGA